MKAAEKGIDPSTINRGFGGNGATYGDKKKFNAFAEMGKKGDKGRAGNAGGEKRKREDGEGEGEGREKKEVSYIDFHIVA